METPIAFHPGGLLLEQVEARGLKVGELAESLHILHGNLTELFNGKRKINAMLAVKLENVLGVDAEYWLGLQSAYDLSIAREMDHF